MHHGRGADVDDVEIVHREQVVETGGLARHVEFGGQGVEAFRVEVADSQQGELVRIGHDAFEDVRAADAAANHGDGFGRAHDRHSELRSAMSCAVRASSIALKQCAWVIAVSVRWRTSAINWRP